jgi:P-type Cu2+ transporter
MTVEVAPAADVSAYVQAEGGLHRLHLMVEGVHCGGCVRRIERELAADPAVAEARVNLTTRRLVVAWRGAAAIGNRLVGRLDALGYRAVPYDPRQLAAGDQATEAWLLRSMAVAGFAAGNVMLLSVAVWAGHFQDMGPATRGLLHWFSALIALPAIVYAARPFYLSALEVLRHGRTNMDVPITLAIVLASAMSLFETLRGGPHVYFDAAITLLFFLLIGRYLDHRARGRARSAAERLLALDAGAVTVLEADGRQRTVPASQVLPGSVVLAAAGERIGVDGRITAGRSDVDVSLITGESVPVAVSAGDPVFAGTINLTAPVRLAVTAAGERTLLAEIVRLMEVAEQRRARHVVLADRVARRYAPVVHILALATFLGWVLLGGIAWQTALLHAVAVLIITCPCALGLAVPVVQVIASGRLLGRGILLKSATALERLAEVDTVVLDKTGTLTRGRPVLEVGAPIDREALAVAARLAGASRHPLARALAAVAPDVPPADGVEEVPGCGLRWSGPAGEVRLGSRAWCGVEGGDESTGMELWLVCPEAGPVRFAFTDEVRRDAGAVVAALGARGLAVELLSGDRAPAVAEAAAAVGIGEWRAGVSPAAKTARLEELRAAGHRVLMVGDGLNDAPALAAAHVSLSPSSAVDISRTAADAVFQGERLAPVIELLGVARRSDRLIRQNIALAILYNVLVVPIAMAGLVTPLIAAISMSASSLVVVGNALRLGSGGSRWRSSSTPSRSRWSWASSASAPSSGR